MRFALRSVFAPVLGLLLTFSAAWASEFRGLWVDAFHPGFKTHEQVTQMVNAAKDANFNALIVQVRKRGDAYYNSSIEPRASDIAPGYDPLADVIEQAHEAGLEVHAWVSVYEVMHDSYKPGPTHIYNTHPEWLMTTQDGRKVFHRGRIYLDPGVPAVQGHILSVILQILKNYDVDGINLDNLRYPGKHGGYNPISVALFHRQLGGTGSPNQDDPVWCQWRRDQITNLVRRVQAVIHQTKPAVKLSASVVFAIPELAARGCLQEWNAWTKNKLVDFLVPMVFLRHDAMTEAAAEALKSSHDRHLYIGVAGWVLSPQLALKQIQDARTVGARGVVLFSYHYLGPNSDAATRVKGEDLLSSVFSEEAAIPVMPWKQ